MWFRELNIESGARKACVLFPVISPLVSGKYCIREVLKSNREWKRKKMTRHSEDEYYGGRTEFGEHTLKYSGSI